MITAQKDSAVHLKMEIYIPIAGGHLEGTLIRPPDAKGLVLFAHGSESGRHSTQSQRATEMLQESGLATVSVDLLTPEEAVQDAVAAELRFNISRLTRRLMDATRWAELSPATRDLPLGFFGIGTAAAAAFAVAARLGPFVRAIVSRSGRPDMAQDSLRFVEAPTLLIVGGFDAEVLSLNRYALRELKCPAELHVVPRSTHPFEESDALDEVACQDAADWFLPHFAAEP